MLGGGFSFSQPEICQWLATTLIWINSETQGLTMILALLIVNIQSFFTETLDAKFSEDLNVQPKKSLVTVKPKK